MRIVLLYNPFSGKLPRQAVEERRDARQYSELPAPTAAVDAVSPVPSEPKMEQSASDITDKKALRRSSAANVTGTGDIRKETSSPYTPSTADMAAKPAPRDNAYQSTAKERIYSQPSVSPP